MNQEKIGRFIANLRKENNMTQEELAKKILISRQAISKWERGVSIPDSETLLILSNLFKVSVNEILLGERINETNKEENENLSLKLYDNMNKKKKIIKLLCIMMTLLVLLFLSYYFINSYKKVKVYTVSGESENYVLTDGMFIKTNEKIYLRLGNIDSSDNIKKISLYYKNKDESKILLISTTQDFIKIVDFKSQNEFFDFKNIDYIIQHMILEIENDNGEIQIIKLQFIEDYINDLETLLTKTGNAYKENKENNSNAVVDSQSDYKKIEEKIFEKFEKSGDGYVYAIKKNNLEYNFFYDETTHLNITTFKNNEIIEELDYILEIDYLSYINYENETNFEIQNGDMNCLAGDCKNYKEILQKYKEIFNSN